MSDSTVMGSLTGYRAAGLGGPLAVCLLSGCMPGPDYHRPALDMPARYQDAAEERISGARQAQATGADTLTSWWGQFRDPLLTSLIERAIAGSLDLASATSRVRRARATLGQATGELGPTLDATGTLSRSRSGIADQSSAGADSATAPSGQTSADDILLANQYRVGFDAAWELDIFGGRRRGVEAARADLEASRAAREDVLVTLTAEVALNYVELRTYQRRIAIARRNLAAQRHSAKIARDRHAAGFVSALDVASTRAQVASTEAEIPRLEALARQVAHNIEVLLGRNPGTLGGELAPGSSASNPGSASTRTLLTPPLPPLGLPSELLRRRPDIRQAEAALKAETARIGVAISDLYPEFTLTGDWGYQSATAGTLLRPDSVIWSFGPTIRWSLFSSGRVQSEIEIQQAEQEAAVVAYRKTVILALREVEDALVALTHEKQRRQSLGESVAANKKAVALATRLYEGGETNYLQVLAAQRSLLDSEDALVQSAGRQATDLITLFKALGGGWDPSRFP